jgi:hypothetical protein
MTDFDPLKALREELAGLAAVGATLKQAEQELVIEVNKAERQLNAMRKLQGFLATFREAKFAELKKLEQEH